MGIMTNQMKVAVERMSELPEHIQDHLADYLLTLNNDGVYQLNTEELTAIEEAEGQIKRGEFMPDEELKALFKKHGL